MSLYAGSLRAVAQFATASAGLLGVRTLLILKAGCLRSSSVTSGTGVKNGATQCRVPALLSSGRKLWVLSSPLIVSPWSGGGEGSGVYGEILSQPFLPASV